MTELTVPGTEETKSDPRLQNQSLAASQVLIDAAFFYNNDQYI